MTLLAYLDPGSGDSGTQLAGVVILVLIVAVVLALLGGTIYVAVRLARRD